MASAAKKQPDDVKTIDELAAMLKLPSWNDVDEMNQDYYWEAARGAEDQQETADVIRDDLFVSWYRAVEAATERLLEAHDLELSPAYKKIRGKPVGDHPFELRIHPVKSWNASADAIRETINGVGYFHFSSLREFLDSGPYTARQAVLEHLGYIKDYPAVYGSKSAQGIYDSYFR